MPASTRAFFAAEGIDLSLEYGFENDYLKLARSYILERNTKIERSRDDSPAEMELILADGSLYPEKGRGDFIDRNIDASTGSILVQATFPNPNRLIRPGQFARVRARLNQEEDAIVVPQKCASELQGQFSVFVVNKENKVETRQIRVSEKVGDYYVVSEGLQVGDLDDIVRAARREAGEFYPVPRYLSKTEIRGLVSRLL